MDNIYWDAKSYFNFLQVTVYVLERKKKILENQKINLSKHRSINDVRIILKNI